MKDGGAAFPTFPDPGSREAYASGGVFPRGGMSLRDYFAAKALVALWSSHEWIMNCGKLAGDYSTMDGAVAKRAYLIADALLAHRDSETLPEERTTCPRCGAPGAGKDDPVNCSACGAVWHRVPQRGYGG